MVMRTMIMMRRRMMMITASDACHEGVQRASNAHELCPTRSTQKHRRMECIFFSPGEPRCVLETVLTLPSDRRKFPRAFLKPRLLFCTDSRSTSSGVAEAGTLKLVFGALKCRNPFFFLEYPFTRYRDTKTLKTLLAV